MTSLVNGPQAALPAVADLCTDIVKSLATAVAPGVPTASVLAQALRFAPNASVAELPGVIATLGASDVEVAVGRMVKNALPWLSQAGLLPSATSSGSGTKRPGFPIPSWIVKATGNSLGLGQLDALPTVDQEKQIRRLDPKLPPVKTAQWLFNQWGGTANIRGTPTWEEMQLPLLSASVLAATVPAFSVLAQAFGLKEVPPSDLVGRRVHRRLQVAYRRRHPGNVVVTDDHAYKETPQGEVDLGTVNSYTKVPPRTTGHLETDVTLALVDYAFSFAKKGFDARKRRLRADILNITSHQLFEIKPVRGAPDAVGQLWAYQVFLNAALSLLQVAEPPLVKPGLWHLPAVVFPISRISDPRFLIACAFMFSGYGELVSLPGIILYVVFEAEHQIQDYEQLAKILILLLAQALRDAGKSPPTDQPPTDTPPPEIDRQYPDEWVPNGHYPGDNKPPSTDEDPTESDPPWDSPTIPPEDQPGASHSSLANRAVVMWLVANWLLVIEIVVTILILALAVVLATLALLVAALVVIADAVLAAFAILATIAVEGLAVAAVAAFVVIVVRALLNNRDLTPTTAALVVDRPGVWAALAALLAQQPGVEPGLLASLGLTEAPAGPASGSATATTA